MDNLTHSLTGLALARAGLKKYSPHGTLLMIVAANLSDIDMVNWLQGPLRNFELHRGYTHSVLCLPLVALGAVVVTALLRWTRLPWLAAWAIACVGVASHLLLDWSMSYGVRLLLPFSSRWYYLDLFSLVDWVVLGVLALAWLGPALGRLVSEEIGEKPKAGRGMAIFALTFFVLYGGFRALMHARAMAQLESRTHSEAFGGSVTRMAALPESVNPLAWNAIVESEHAYRLFHSYTWANLDPSEDTLVYKPAWNQTFKQVSGTEAFRYTLYFARFPFWQESPGPKVGWSLVSLTDLRFGAPGESFLMVHALVDPAGRVEQTWFGGFKPSP
jgi:inner membrane protein